MADEVKIKSESKMNKKILYIATAVVLIMLAVAVISVISKSAKADKMEKQLVLGDKYLSELDYEQARVTYQSLIEIDPKCEDAYLGLADTYIAQGEYDMAETALKEALDT